MSSKRKAPSDQSTPTKSPGTNQPSLKRSKSHKRSSKLRSTPIPSLPSKRSEQVVQLEQALQTETHDALTDIICYTVIALALSVNLPEPEFSYITVQLRIALPPCFDNDPLKGVHGYLRCFLMKYLPVLHGVVIAYDKVRFVEPRAELLDESPFSRFHVTTKMLVWKPSPGTILSGVINIQSPAHIGLLIYDTFNATIPAGLIDQDRYEFQQAGITDSAHDEDGQDGNGTAEVIDSETAGQYDGEQSTGQWVASRSGKPLGKKGRLTFAAIK
ncbi:hypothetical protein IWQ60_004813 [Tieghemiomyces parasiticus]|uniref:RPA43 OB domain-containing protein n=1 Tax=Tieghemiomyces parasiticus TaxID=78921 RepID=A0A9W8DYT4_9FUNG|nr:hypothetical protein IWQ60_004813 [Tieghemiomyces parasiticus]